MSAYEIARDMSVDLLSILTYAGATKWVSRTVGDNPYEKRQPWKALAHVLPVRLFEVGFFQSKTITKMATVASKMTATHETPYVWAREFLEESGFNLTERIPAVLGVHKVPGADESSEFPLAPFVPWVSPYLAFQILIQTIVAFGIGDLAWLLFVVAVIIILYLWRCHVIITLSLGWKELKQDVATFVRRNLYSASGNTAIISAADIEILNISANAIQKRINALRMSKINFIRSRTGIIFNLNTLPKLRIQLIKARDALKKQKAAKGEVKSQLAEVTHVLEAEKASHAATQGFLEQQRTLRENAEVQLARLQKQLKREQDNYRSVFKTKEIFRHGGLKLKKAWNIVQADYNVLQDSHDRWQETFEASETKASAQVVNDVGARIVSDNLRNGHQIDDRDDSDGNGYNKDHNPDSRNDDEGESDDGHNGGFEKLATDADRPQEHHVTTSSNPAEATQQRESSMLNGSASEFVPSPRSTRPVPPILPHHQAYTASQLEVKSRQSGSDSAFPSLESQPRSVESPKTQSSPASVQGSVHGQDPFAGTNDEAKSHDHEASKHAPASKAVGPGKAKNAHIQKLNEDFKRLEWRRKSGMPDLEEDQEGAPGPSNVLGKHLPRPPQSLCDLTN